MMNNCVHPLGMITIISPCGTKKVGTCMSSQRGKISVNYQIMQATCDYVPAFSKFMMGAT